MSVTATGEGGMSAGLRRVSSVIALLSLLIVLSLGARWFLELGWAWRCPMLTLFHLPCPSCGSTRAFAALAHLDLIGALRFNPLLVCILPALGIGLMLRERLRMYSSFGWPLLLGAVLLNWLYLFFFLPR